MPYSLSLLNFHANTVVTSKQEYPDAQTGYKGNHLSLVWCCHLFAIGWGKARKYI